MNNKEFYKVANSEFVGYSDLHCHLGSSCSAPILWELAHEQGINIGIKNFFEFEETIYLLDKIEWEKYLEKFHLTQKIQSTPAAIEKSVYMAISSAYRKYKITNIELRFNPILRSQQGRYDLDHVILHAIRGMQKATMVYPIKAGLIIETGRDFPKRESKILAEKAVKYKHMGIIGFDISGTTHDKPFELGNFVEAYEIAKDGGLGITVHAGETPGSCAEMKEIVKKLQPDRVGHGIRCVDDEDFLMDLAEKQICLEICPTSNIQTGCSTMDDLTKTLNKLREFNVRHTINTDGPIFLVTSIHEELEKLKNAGAIDEKTLDDLVYTSHFCSFNNGYRAIYKEMSY